ncbi:MAG: hypothetical protein HY863_01900 [Chloroflexi bacterium]|nr:hypothetical protein [Chloroflexota bacterium]
MKRLSIIFLILAIGLSACGRKDPAPLGADAPGDNVPNIVGSYALNGFDPGGEEYGGTLSITDGEQPNEYKLQWLVTGAIHEGTGILAGNQLTATWHSISETDQTISGSASYTVTINGELYGTRSIDGVESPGTETAYPNPK